MSHTTCGLCQLAVFLSFLILSFKHSLFLIFVKLSFFLSFWINRSRLISPSLRVPSFSASVMECFKGVIYSRHRIPPVWVIRIGSNSGMYRSVLACLLSDGWPISMPIISYDICAMRSQVRSSVRPKPAQIHATIFPTAECFVSHPLRITPVRSLNGPDLHWRHGVYRHWRSSSLRWRISFRVVAVIMLGTRRRFQIIPKIARLSSRSLYKFVTHQLHLPFRGAIHQSVHSQYCHIIHKAY